MHRSVAPHKFSKITVIVNGKALDLVYRLPQPSSIMNNQERCVPVFFYQFTINGRNCIKVKTNNDQEKRQVIKTIRDLKYSYYMIPIKKINFINIALMLNEVRSIKS